MGSEPETCQHEQNVRDAAPLQRGSPENGLSAESGQLSARKASAVGCCTLNLRANLERHEAVSRGAGDQPPFLAPASGMTSPQTIPWLEECSRYLDRHMPSSAGSGSCRKTKTQSRDELRQMLAEEKPEPNPEPGWIRRRCLQVIPAAPRWPIAISPDGRRATVVVFDNGILGVTGPLWRPGSALATAIASRLSTHTRRWPPNSTYCRCRP